MVALEARDTGPTLRDWLAHRLAKSARRKAARVRVSAAGGGLWLYALSKLVLHLAGFSLLTFAGFSFNMPAGLITAGVSCFVLSWLFRPPVPSQ